MLETEGENWTKLFILLRFNSRWRVKTSTRTSDIVNRTKGLSRDIVSSTAYRAIMVNVPVDLDIIISLSYTTRGTIT